MNARPNPDPKASKPYVRLSGVHELPISGGIDFIDFYIYMHFSITYPSPLKN